jgi:peroxiredoxin family protein
MIEVSNVNLNEKSKDQKGLTILMSSDQMDRALLAFMIANSARSIGVDVNMFFALWGINLLRRKKGQPGLKGTGEGKTFGFMQKMMGSMMPKGPTKIPLSKMNFGGLGSMMMRSIMKKQGIASLPELMNMSVDLDVEFTVCSMTMDIMGFKEDDLLDLPNMSFAGVTSCLGDAMNSKLFFVI